MAKVMDFIKIYIFFVFNKMREHLITNKVGNLKNNYYRKRVTIFFRSFWTKLIVSLEAIGKNTIIF